MGIWIHQQIF